MHRTFGSRGCPTLHLADRYAERKTPTLCFAFSARTRQAGIPLEDIKDFLGHKDVSTTQVYAHISPVSSLSLKLSLILFISEHVSITDFLNLAKNPYLKGVRSILWQGLQSLACLEVRTWFSYSSCRKIFLMMILSIN